MERLGDYTIERELARGGMGAVYVARDPTGRRVALKLLLEENDRTERERFRREAESLGRIQHPGVVGVHDFGQDPRGRDYLVLTLIEGESLDERLKREGPLEPREAAQLGRAVADALAAAHAQGVLHRDMKPSNVLLRTEDGAPVVTDFGLARVTDQSQRLTQTGTMHGTPAYMPPEQAAGELNRIGPPSDVYGLGALLFATLTGRPPFQGHSMINILKGVLTDPAPRASSIQPGVPAALDTIVARCLEKEPGQRYPSAEALRDALDRFLAGESEALAARGPMLAALLTAAVVVGLIVAGLVLQRTPPAQQAAADLERADRSPEHLEPRAESATRIDPKVHHSLAHPSWRNTPPVEIGVRFRSDGSLLTWGRHKTKGATIRVWVAASFEALGAGWKLSRESVHALAAAREAERVALILVDSNERRRVVDLVPGGKTSPLADEDVPKFYTAIALSHDGQRLALGVRTQKYRIDLHGPGGLRVLNGPQAPIHGLAFGPRGGLVSVSGSGTGNRLEASNSIMYYDSAGKASRRLGIMGDPEAVATDGDRCFVGDTNRRVHRFALPVTANTKPSQLELPGQPGSFDVSKASAKGSVRALRLRGPYVFAYASEELPDPEHRTELRIWKDAQTPRVVGGITAFDNLQSIDVSPDGHWVALGLREVAQAGHHAEVWPVARLVQALRTRKGWLKAP